MEDHNALPIYSDLRENGPRKEGDFSVLSHTFYTNLLKIKTEQGIARRLFNLSFLKSKDTKSIPSFLVEDRSYCRK